MARSAPGDRPEPPIVAPIPDQTIPIGRTSGGETVTIDADWFRHFEAKARQSGQGFDNIFANQFQQLSVPPSVQVDGITRLVDLEDVDASGQAARTIPIFDTASNVYVVGLIELNDNSDVTISGTPSSRQFLIYDGSKWENATPTLDDLADVINTTPPNDGELLRYDASVTAFVATDQVIDNLSDIGDVSSAAPSDNQVLTYDTASGTWGPEDAQTIAQIKTNFAKLVVEEVAGDVEYQIEWEVNDDVDTSIYNLCITAFDNGTYATNTEITDPKSTTSTVLVNSGAADGSSNFHHIFVNVTRATDSAFVHSLIVCAQSEALSILLQEDGDALLKEDGGRIVLEGV